MELLSIMETDNNQMLTTTITINGNEVFFVEPAVKIMKSPNAHNTMEFLGKIKYNDYEAAIKDLNLNSSIRIEFGIEGSQLLLFCGLITSIDIVSVPDKYYPLYDIQILELSYSCLFDFEKKCRVYQDKKASHKQIIQNILSAYPDSNFTIPPELREIRYNQYYQNLSQEAKNRYSLGEGWKRPMNMRIFPLSLSIRL